MVGLMGGYSCLSSTQTLSKRDVCVCVCLCVSVCVCECVETLAYAQVLGQRAK